jgi:hypothetical protein
MVARFMYWLKTTHQNVAKRILQYAKGIIEYGIEDSIDGEFQIIGYTCRLDKII